MEILYETKYFLLLFVLVAVADSCERVQSRCPFDVEMNNVTLLQVFDCAYQASDYEFVYSSTILEKVGKCLLM